MHKRWNVAVALLATVAGTGTAAIAADQPAMGRPGWDRAEMRQMHAQREAARADDMAVLIGLRADQRPAFDRFLAAMRPPHDGPEDRDGGGRPKPPSEAATLPARLDAMAASADRRDAMAKQRIAAARQFYAGLTLDQQRRFDALDRLHAVSLHGHPGGMGGPRGPGPDAGPPPPPGN